MCWDLKELFYIYKNATNSQCVIPDGSYIHLGDWLKLLLKSKIKVYDSTVEIVTLIIYAK